MVTVQLTPVCVSFIFFLLINISHNLLDANDNQLLMCVPGCGSTGKSQLIRVITEYFQVTKRRKMLRKLAPTSKAAAAEIDGLTIHSFLGESRNNSKKKPTRTFRPDDAKLESECRHVKYLIIDEMSMVGLRLLARLNRIVKTAKHLNSEASFGGINVIFFQRLLAVFSGIRQTSLSKLDIASTIY